MSAASAQVRWALLAGNFVIGCGVMVVAGTLNDLAHSLGVSVALAGQLIALGALGEVHARDGVCVRVVGLAQDVAREIGHVVDP